MNWAKVIARRDAKHVSLELDTPHIRDSTVYLHFILFFDTETAQFVENYLLRNTWISIFHSQYRDCRWPCGTRSQDISINVSDPDSLVSPLEWLNQHDISGECESRVNHHQWLMVTSKTQVLHLTKPDRTLKWSPWGPRVISECAWFLLENVNIYLHIFIIYIVKALSFFDIKIEIFDHESRGPV